MYRWHSVWLRQTISSISVTWSTVKLFIYITVVICRWIHSLSTLINDFKMRAVSCITKTALYHVLVWMERDHTVWLIEREQFLGHGIDRQLTRLSFKCPPPLFLSINRSHITLLLSRKKIHSLCLDSSAQFMDNWSVIMYIAVMCRGFLSQCTLQYGYIYAGFTLLQTLSP